MTSDEALAAIRELHPKIEHPRHGCCAAPASCSPDWASAFGKGHGAYLALKPREHPPECGGRDHGINRPRWPCPTMQVILAAESGDTLAVTSGP